VLYGPIVCVYAGNVFGNVSVKTLAVPTVPPGAAGSVTSTDVSTLVIVALAKSMLAVPEKPVVPEAVPSPAALKLSFCSVAVAVLVRVAAFGRARV
jgi:hypothetical protein